MRVRITIEADLRGGQGAIDLVREALTVSCGGAIWLHKDTLPREESASGTFSAIKVARMREPRQKTGGNGK